MRLHDKHRRATGQKSSPWWKKEKGRKRRGGVGRGGICEIMALPPSSKKRADFTAGQLSEGN